MALIDPNKSTKLDIPHEPGEWIRIRPITAAQAAAMGDNMNTLSVLSAVVVEWSYSEPVSPETVGQLDLRTAQWLTEEVMSLSGMRSEEESRNLGSASLPTLEPVVAGSQNNSHT